MNLGILIICGGGLFITILLDDIIFVSVVGDSSLGDFLFLLDICCNDVVKHHKRAAFAGLGTLTDGSSG